MLGEEVSVKELFLAKNLVASTAEVLFLKAKVSQPLSDN